MKNSEYHWRSKLTGEIVRNLYEVIITFFQDLRYYEIWNSKWEYNKKGF